MGDEVPLRGRRPATLGLWRASRLREANGAWPGSRVPAQDAPSTTQKRMPPKGRPVEDSDLRLASDDLFLCTAPRRSDRVSGSLPEYGRSTLPSGSSQSRRTLTYSGDHQARARAATTCSLT